METIYYCKYYGKNNYEYKVLNEKNGILVDTYGNKSHLKFVNNVLKSNLHNFEWKLNTAYYPKKHYEATGPGRYIAFLDQKEKIEVFVKACQEFKISPGSSGIYKIELKEDKAQEIVEKKPAIKKKEIVEDIYLKDVVKDKDGLLWPKDVLEKALTNEVQKIKEISEEELKKLINPIF